MTDTQTITIAQAVLNCLCTNLNANPNPPMHCCFRVGTEVAFDAGQQQDLCCEGLAYVTMGDIFPSVSSFPDQDIIRQVQGSCAPPAWAVQFDLGVIRCAPTGDENYPPDCTDWGTAFTTMANDAQALRKTACCVRNWVMDPANNMIGMSVVLNRQSSSPIQGGCMERKMSLVVQMKNCDC